MLHIGAGHSNNCQIILKLFGYDIFCNNLQHKNNFKEIGSFRFIKPFPVCVPGEKMMKNWKSYFNLKIAYTLVN